MKPLTQAERKSEMTQKSGGIEKERREAKKSFFLTIWLWVRSLRSTPLNVKNSFV